MPVFPLSRVAAARTRKFFVLASTFVENNVPAVGMPTHGYTVNYSDDAPAGVIGFFTVPEDFLSGMSVEAVIAGTDGSGNIRVMVDAQYGSDGESVITHTESTGYSTEAVVIGQFSYMKTLVLASVAKGDMVALVTSRSTTHVDDDDIAVDMYGWIVSYTADS